VLHQVHRRICWNGTLNSFLKWKFIIEFDVEQFALGGLNPGAVLRMIEEAANDDPVELQDGFNAYDECSNISIQFI
jgi:hypothetical protein